MHLALLVALATAGPLGGGEAEPDTLNPLFARTMADHRAHARLFEPLFSAGEAGFSSRLVSRLELSEDRREVRLELAPGHAWRDGEPLTAGDVCFTVSALSHPDTGTTWPHTDVLAGCRVEGESAVIRFSQAVVRDPRVWLGFMVLPAHAFEHPVVHRGHPFGRSPVGLNHPGEAPRPPAALVYVALSLGGDLNDAEVRQVLVRLAQGADLVPGAQRSTGPWPSPAPGSPAPAAVDEGELLAGVPLRVGVAAELLDRDPGLGQRLCATWEAAGAESCASTRLSGSSWYASADRMDALVGSWTLTPPHEPGPFLKWGNPYGWEHGETPALVSRWRAASGAEEEQRVTRDLERLWQADGAFAFLGIIQASGP